MVADAPACDAASSRLFECIYDPPDRRTAVRAPQLVCSAGGNCPEPVRRVSTRGHAGTAGFSCRPPPLADAGSVACPGGRVCDATDCPAGMRVVSRAALVRSRSRFRMLSWTMVRTRRARADPAAGCGPGCRGVELDDLNGGRSAATVRGLSRAFLRHDLNPIFLSR